MSGETAEQICQRWGCVMPDKEWEVLNEERRKFMATLLFIKSARLLPIKQVLLKLKDKYDESCYVCKIDGTELVVMFGKMMSCLWRVGTIDNDNITWMHQDTENDIKGKVDEEHQRAILIHVTNMCATVSTYLKSNAVTVCVDIWMKYYS